MAFVKLDCGILNSTIWFDRDARELFVTALLMAEPIELRESTPSLETDSLKESGFIVPPGWYGFVPAAGTGIIRMSGMDKTAGMAALGRLASPEEESRTPDFDGRRMVRIPGGFIILNYDKYRQRDYTSAERSQRYRDRKKHIEKSRVADVTSRVTQRDITQGEGEGEGEGETKTESTQTNTRSPNGGECVSSDLFNIPESPKPDKEAITDPVLLRLYALFRRRATTMPSVKERQAYKVAKISEEDLASVEEWWNDPHPEWKGDNFRRRDLLTLLNKWNAAVDTATGWKKPAREGKQHIDVVQAELNGIFGRPKDAPWSADELAAYDAIDFDIDEDALRRLKYYYSVKTDDSISDWSRPTSLLTCVKRLSQVIDAAKLYRPKSAF